MSQDVFVNDDKDFPVTHHIDRRTIRNAKLDDLIARVFSRLWIVVRLLHAVGNRLRIPRQIVDGHKRSLRSSRYTNSIPERPEEIGYEGDTEVQTFLNYRNQLAEKWRLTGSESESLYEKIIDTISNCLNTEPQIRNVLNLGVSYAYVDSILAREHENVEFVGIDRSPFTKALNEVEFGDIPNLTFVSGELDDHLRQMKYQSGLFLHARTAVVFSRPMLEDLYKAAYDAGFEFIAGFEQIGLSRETFKPFEFSLDYRDSVHYRGRMNIHNYPNLLLNAGYKLDRFELFQTGHRRPDFKMVAFVARRRN